MKLTLTGFDAIFWLCFQFTFNEKCFGDYKWIDDGATKKRSKYCEWNSLAKVAKQWLQTMRDDGWKSLYDEIFLFCKKYNIVVPNMDDIYCNSRKATMQHP